MKTWFTKFWNDTESFESVCRVVARLGVAIVGGLIGNGTIPTGIDGGNMWGPIISALGLAIPARPAVPMK